MCMFSITVPFYVAKLSILLLSLLIYIYIVDKEKHCQGPVQMHVLTYNYFPLCLGLRQIRLDQIDLPSEHV